MEELEYERLGFYGVARAPLEKLETQLRCYFEDFLGFTLRMFFEGETHNIVIELLRIDKDSKDQRLRAWQLCISLTDFKSLTYHGDIKYYIIENFHMKFLKELDEPID